MLTTRPIELPTDSKCEDSRCFLLICPPGPFLQRPSSNRSDRPRNVDAAWQATARFQPAGIHMRGSTQRRFSIPSGSVEPQSNSPLAQIEKLHACVQRVHAETCPEPGQQARVPFQARSSRWFLRLCCRRESG